MVKVSIVVPIYNTENYVERCLDSLLKQTLTDIEIICVNDASTDASLTVVEKRRIMIEELKSLIINTILEQGKLGNMA